MSSDAEWRSWFLGWRRRPSCTGNSTQNPADYATELTSRNAAGNATWNTAEIGVGRHWLFFKNYNLLGDGNGSEKLSAGEELLPGHGHRFYSNRGRRRGRGRRWPNYHSMSVTLQVQCIRVPQGKQEHGSKHRCMKQRRTQDVRQARA
jgi:hypothetical protein